MKKISAILMILVISLSAILPVCAEEAPIALTVNGAAVECDVPPQIIEDRTMVPLRAAFEAFGAKIILWDESTSTVHAQATNGNVISLQIGSNKLFIANNVLEMDVPAMIIGDRTMVSIRAIADALGCYVEWDPTSRTVIILEN